MCKEQDREELTKIIYQLANREIRLKEWCDLDSYLKGDKEYRTSDFWWDIENDYFFWRSNEDFNSKFKDVLFAGVQKKSLIQNLKTFFCCFVALWILKIKKWK